MIRKVLNIVEEVTVHPDNSETCELKGTFTEFDANGAKISSTPVDTSDIPATVSKFFTKLEKQVEAEAEAAAKEAEEVKTDQNTPPSDDAPPPEKVEVSIRDSREVLDAVATELGLDPAKYANKDELVDAIHKAQRKAARK